MPYRSSVIALRAGEAVLSPVQKLGYGREMPTVSLTMIVRDEASNLPACLECCAGLFDEMVIVDTGSTDATKDIARSFGARVLDFQWCDDFSAARNESLRHAAGDWIFWMDADDRLDEENRAKLRSLLSSIGDQRIERRARSPNAEPTVGDAVMGVAEWPSARRRIALALPTSTLWWPCEVSSRL